MIEPDRVISALSYLSVELKLQILAELQLLAFSGDGLMRWRHRVRAGQPADAPATVLRSLRRWAEIRRTGRAPVRCDGWLVNEPWVLQSVTVNRRLRMGIESPWVGSAASPLNSFEDSYGMLSFLCLLWCERTDEVVGWLRPLTHGHPDAVWAARSWLLLASSSLSGRWPGENAETLLKTAPSRWRGEIYRANEAAELSDLGDLKSLGDGQSAGSWVALSLAVSGGAYSAADAIKALQSTELCKPAKVAVMFLVAARFQLQSPEPFEYYGPLLKLFTDLKQGFESFDEPAQEIWLDYPG